MSGALPQLEAKLLYRQLDQLLAKLDPRKPQKELLESFLEDCFETLRDALRLKAGLLYEQGRDAFLLTRTVGDPGGHVAETLDPSRPPLTLVFQHRLYIFSDPTLEGSPQRQQLLPMAGCAALIVGRRPKRHVIFFILGDGWALEELDFALNTVRAALGSRLVDERVRGSFREAAEIQQSLLLEEPPQFTGYEIACRSIPAEEVGGDLYDFILFDDEMVGLAIGDASGHGLPAALLVRDIVTGLRMGIEKELKVAHVFEKLNRVIHRSNLSSRFVSVFYGELEREGNLIYVNAGHPPPLLFSGDRELALTEGGTVIGPLPEARFRRGVVQVRRGDLLVLCTDGVLERRNSASEFFGVEGIRRVVALTSHRSADEILEALFAATIEHGDGRPWEDDATAIVVKRPHAAPPPAPPPSRRPTSRAPAKTPKTPESGRR